MNYIRTTAARPFASRYPHLEQSSPSTFKNRDPTKCFSFRKYSFDNEQTTLAKNDSAMKLLNDSIVGSAVRQDKGRYAKFQSYTVKNFLKPGDNHSSFITGITANYIDDTGSNSVKYVVKLNPLKSVKPVVCAENCSLRF